MLKSSEVVVSVVVMWMVAACGSSSSGNGSSAGSSGAGAAGQCTKTAECPLYACECGVAPTVANPRGTFEADAQICQSGACASEADACKVACGAMRATWTGHLVSEAGGGGSPSSPSSPVAGSAGGSGAGVDAGSSSGCVDGAQSLAVQIALDDAFDWVGSKTYLALSLTDPDASPGFSPLAPVLGGGQGEGKLSAVVNTTNCARAVHLHVVANPGDSSVSTCEGSFDVRGHAKIVLGAPMVSGRSCVVSAPLLD